MSTHGIESNRLRCSGEFFPCTFGQPYRRGKNQNVTNGFKWRAGSVQAFRADRQGTGIAFRDLNSKMTDFRNKKRRGLDTAADPFFGDDKPAEDHRKGKQDRKSSE